MISIMFHLFCRYDKGKQTVRVQQPNYDQVIVCLDIFSLMEWIGTGGKGLEKEG